MWVTLEKILTFVFSFASGIILSRLLTPADFGLYAFYLSIIVVIFRLFNIGISSEIMHLDTKILIIVVYYLPCLPSILQLVYSLLV